MSTIFHHAKTPITAAAVEAPSMLHHRHVHPSNFSTNGNLTAPQNATELGSIIASNMTEVVVEVGMVNGTSNMTTTSASSTALLESIGTENYGPQINFTIWLLTVLSASFLALRVYCKFIRHRGLWWDDYLLIASWLALGVGCAFVSYTITIGFGRPLREFHKENLVPYLLTVNMAGTFSILAATWSKTSFAITVLRISDGWTKRFIWFVIVSVNVALGLSVAFTWGQCMPFEKIYKPSVPGTCWDKSYQIRYNIFTAAYSGAMDIVLAVLPWKIIWTLTMNRKEKLGVLAAMSMGIFAGVTSIIKITTLPGIGNSDFTESTTQLVILATAESAITIMAASIPILRALVRDVRLPPAPAGFYHEFNEMYSGTAGSRGTGRTSTVIISLNDSSSRSRSRSWSRSRISRASTRWSKDWFEGASRADGGGRTSLKRWSVGHHRRVSSAASAMSHVPPGKILTTEEVVIEYERTSEGIGKAF